MLLCIVMVISVACLSVSAVTLFPVGDFYYQKINNNTEFEIYEYNGTSSFVITPFSHNDLPITTVGANAFDSNSSLTQVMFSESMTTISHHAFQNCSNLQKVVFMNDAVTSIGNYAFAGCSKLTSIPLEKTKITTVSSGMFMNCSSLAEITIPDTVTAIEADAFTNCSALSKIVIPASVTAIDENAFVGADNVVIHCYSDSVAHNYAVDNAISFVLLDAKETFILGDVDNDKAVAVIDATAIQLYLVSKYADEDGRLSIRADVDFDNVVSIMDATNIQKYKADLLGDDTNIGKTFEY